MTPKGKIRRTAGRNRNAISLEVLVEEESASTALRPILEKIVQDRDVRCNIRHFTGKPDLLKKLPNRLSGYAAARRRGEDIRVVVLIDRDTDDCSSLKKALDTAARKAGLTARSQRGSDGTFHVLTRIAIRELESWYYGDWEAVRAGFPKAPKETPRAYRGNPDLVDKKCSEDFERALRASGVRIASKPEWGRRIGPHLSVDKNRSPSFRAFVAGVREITASPGRQA